MSGNANRAASCLPAHTRRGGRLRYRKKETHLHPEAISRQSAVSLATAVGTAQRLDYLYQHGQSQAVGAQPRAFFLFTVKDTNMKTQKFYGDAFR